MHLITRMVYVCIQCQGNDYLLIPLNRMLQDESKTLLSMFNKYFSTIDTASSIALTSLFVSKDLYNIVYRHIQHLHFTRDKLNLLCK